MLRHYIEQLWQHGKNRMESKGIFSEIDWDFCSEEELDKHKQSIKTDLKKLILSHNRISQLRKPWQEYIANQLVTVFCKGKNMETALKEISQNCGRQTRATATTVTEDLAPHLTKITTRQRLANSGVIIK